MQTIFMLYGAITQAENCYELFAWHRKPKIILFKTITIWIQHK